ncbi:class F sortase [Frankia gtarii]|uniref:class F sortase n=1 Tax=Frankia gtarii TaxID=2950102 RepID=UPI0021C07193|nr:class F sortase [Frankia gtarii]
MPSATLREAVLATAIALVLIAGCGPEGTSTRDSHPPAAVPSDTGPASAAGPAEGQVAPPVRVRIPDIGVDAAVVPLGLDAGGTLQAPTDFATAGWNVAGPEPGENGAAVVAGHVDSTTGPAAFFRLGALHPGARVFIDRADGSTVTFVVRRLVRYPKSAIPDAEVYGGSPGSPGLRLITCGGAFDHARGHYLDNVVVYATD